MRMIGKPQSKNNPLFCNPCAPMLNRPGGAEVEVTLLFADVRGSTTLAEQMSASAYSRLMQRFYHTATDILVHSDAMIDKFVGDQVIALYIPGFAGQQHAQRAVEAAQHLIRATGHGDGANPWLPVGRGYPYGYRLRWYC